MTKNSAHANCSHEATKSARAKCRREAAQSPLNAQLDKLLDAKIAASDAELAKPINVPTAAQREEYTRLCEEAGMMINDTKRVDRIAADLDIEI